MNDKQSEKDIITDLLFLTIILVGVTLALIIDLKLLLETADHILIWTTWPWLEESVRLRVELPPWLIYQPFGRFWNDLLGIPCYLIVNTWLITKESKTKFEKNLYTVTTWFALPLPLFLIYYINGLAGFGFQVLIFCGLQIMVKTVYVYFWHSQRPFVLSKTKD